MPALHRASKVQNRASKAGLRNDERPLREVAEALASLEGYDGVDAEKIVGLILFDLVDYSRRAGLDAEIALIQAIARFESEINAIESDRT
jgi:uncharacterized protein YabN with tetrapyrrole methylase and pyrophosphatase domain